MSLPEATERGWTLVTGASSGIGTAFCRVLRARGEKVILVARRADRLRDLVMALGGDEFARAIPIDLTAPGSAAAIEAAVARGGLTVDVLVNNAGFGDSGRFQEEPLDRVLGMIDLNVRALVELTHRFVGPMITRRRGCVINVVSTSAFQPIPFFSVYAATKAFVLSFTEALAWELKGTGVQVQALCPGLTATEFQQVAGTDRVPFNKTAIMSAERVVQISMAALDRGRVTVITGWQNRLVAAAQRWMPPSLVRRVAAELFRPRGAGSP